MSPYATLRQMPAPALFGLVSAMACQVALLSVAGVNNRHLLHPDGVSYLLIAQHYARGEFDLAVSGYWGPMLSWLLAPLLVVFKSPLDAARIVMAFSAVLFLLGSITVFHSFQMRSPALVISAWIVALASVYWSVSVDANLTPDLLMSGFMCMAISRMAARGWTQRRSTQLFAGILLGVAYLAKPVAFPVAFGVSLVIALLWIISRLSDFKTVARSLTITWLGLLLLASPWIAILSVKYHSLVISTSARINHAIVGPPDIQRGHLSSRMFHKPEPGKLSSGQDATFLPYKFWSPFSSVQYFKHQLSLMQENLGKIITHLSSFDRFHLALAAALFGFLVHIPWRENMARDRWRWAAVPILFISGIYIPVFANAERYYYAAYSFLLVSSMGMVTWLTQNSRAGINISRIVGISLVAFSFASQVRGSIAEAVAGLEYPPSVLASELATKLRSNGLEGPIAGTGDCQRWAGLYVEYIAFFMQQPYYGCEENTTLSRIKASEAQLVVLTPSASGGNELENDRSFRNLDHLLFNPDQQRTNGFPWKIYERIDGPFTWRLRTQQNGLLVPRP
jgi:hypothetical protein